MSNFLPLISKTYEFEGDTITASFKRLTRGQMILISPFIQNSTDKESQSVEDQMRLIDITVNALSENIESFEGLKDSDDCEIAFDTAQNEAYFMSLLSEMAMDLITESMVQEKK